MIRRNMLSNGGGGPIGHIPSDGVYIEDTEHTLYTKEGWASEGAGKTPNALVVVSFPNAFRMALTKGRDIPILEHEGSLVNYMTAIKDTDQAILDMDSAGNTANILKIQGSTEYAAGYCDAFVFPDGTTKGVLPALGWWRIAYNRKSNVDACLQACGGDAIDLRNYQWSSTFWGTDAGGEYVWQNDWEYGSANSNTPTYGSTARPFAEYPLADTIIIDQTD